MNWFRKNKKGFIWPGFGDNLRVLEWIIKRCQNKIEALETPIGFLPNLDDIDTKGLEITDESMTDLFNIDQNQWLQEMDSIKDYFSEYGDRMPEMLIEEHSKVVRALKNLSD